MTKINICLMSILILCALGVVTSQHEARKLFATLESEHEMTHQLEVEWGKLQLQQSMQVTHGMIESAAREQLNMGMPAETRMHTVMPTYFVGLTDAEGLFIP